MKTLLVAILVACGAWDQACAQSAGLADSSRRDARFDLFRGISLSPAQRIQIDSIDQLFAAHAKEANSRNSAAEGVLYLSQRSAARDSAIQSVLTSDQRVVYRRNLDSLRAWARRERH